MRKSLTLALLCLATNASAGFLTVETFMDMADSRNDVKTTYIHGYVIGLADQLQYEGLACIPSSTKVKQVTSRVVEALQTVMSRPDVDKYPAGPLVYAALRDTYPCKESNDMKYTPPKSKQKKDIL